MASSALLLHPRPQLVGAVQLVGRVGVEHLDRLRDGGAGLDLLGHGLHLGGDPGQLVLPPGVGLLEVDGGAEEGTRDQLVALAAAGIGLRCLRAGSRVAGSAASAA